MLKLPFVIKFIVHEIIQMNRERRELKGELGLSTDPRDTLNSFDASTGTAINPLISNEGPRLPQGLMDKYSTSRCPRDTGMGTELSIMHARGRDEVEDLDDEEGLVDASINRDRNDAACSVTVVPEDSEGPMTPERESMETSVRSTIDLSVSAVDGPFDCSHHLYTVSNIFRLIEWRLMKHTVMVSETKRNRTYRFLFGHEKFHF